MSSANGARSVGIQGLSLIERVAIQKPPPDHVSDVISAVEALHQAIVAGKAGEILGHYIGSTELPHRNRDSPEVASSFGNREAVVELTAQKLERLCKLVDRRQRR